MADPKQSEGRRANGAMPGGKPDQTTSDAEVKRTGEASRRKAGPDGPDATEIGDTFKRSPH
ncbi:hypothetical protein [Brevundimonas sp. M20]|jgi:hypothetical protein|uniref:hypothetical protein n=1 Tax=Brevundimonas sp. M20 TaxID=2591463 RepID=UPI0011478BF5|nr:hypothetical protein [Brevundimonas sp. M20]QDH74720.1 hypothetical protein FKQ52_15665 [Brevundimonas sp. M20]